MASVSTHLNFRGRTEEAFRFYQSVFDCEPVGPIVRIRDIPAKPGQTRSEEQGNRIAHMALAIVGGHVLRGTDVPDVVDGNNVHIMLEPDTREEADRLYAALSAGGQQIVPLADMFWGAYFGQLVDRFGVPWLVNIDAR